MAYEKLDVDREGFQNALYGVVRSGVWESGEFSLFPTKKDAQDFVEHMLEEGDFDLEEDNVFILKMGTEILSVSEETVKTVISFTQI